MIPSLSSFIILLSILSCCDPFLISAQTSTTTTTIILTTTTTTPPPTSVFSTANATTAVQLPTTATPTTTTATSLADLLSKTGQTKDIDVPLVAGGVAGGAVVITVVIIVFMVLVKKGIICKGNLLPEREPDPKPPHNRGGRHYRYQGNKYFRDKDERTFWWDPEVREWVVCR